MAKKTLQLRYDAFELDEAGARLKYERARAHELVPA
jgi:hypothetical protein